MVLTWLTTADGGAERSTMELAQGFKKVMGVDVLRPAGEVVFHGHVPERSMRYPAQREHVVRAVSQLTRWGSLDPGGGAVSVRTDSGNIVSTTAGGAIEHWDISPRDLIVYDAEGAVVERTGGHAPVDTPLHLAAYREFSHCHALVHAHAPYSLAFASLGMGVPTVTTHSDLLGEVPCCTFDESAIQGELAAGRVEVRVPACMRSRPEAIAGYELGLIPQMRALVGPRADEVRSHGVGFLAYRHGVFVLARTLTAAVATLHNIECTARTALFQAILHGGIAGIEPDVLLGGRTRADGADAVGSLRSRQWTKTARTPPTWPGCPAPAAPPARCCWTAPAACWWCGRSTGRSTGRAGCCRAE